MDQDKTIKYAVGVLSLLVAFAGWRWMHPKTTFAADGADAAWDAAAQRAQDSGKPTVLLFTASWCPACRALHATTLAREDVQRELSEHYNYFVVDLTNPTLATSQHADKMGVHAIPTLVRYNADGKETGREHYLDPSRMMAFLKDGE
jgi:thiol:disulfide interchange protein DsbD